MNNILESLEAYFANNTREQIEKDWAELSHYDNIGPTVNDFLSQCLDLIPPQNHYTFKTNKKSPKFTSDFFYTLAIIKKNLYD